MAFPWRKINSISDDLVPGDENLEFSLINAQRKYIMILEHAGLDTANELGEETHKVSDYQESLRSVSIQVEARDIRIRDLEAQIAILKFDWTSVPKEFLDYIPCIKFLREQTGAGLRDAKMAVDEAMASGKIKIQDRPIPQEG